MKKHICILCAIACLLLCGCQAKETSEPVSTAVTALSAQEQTETVQTEATETAAQEQQDLKEIAASMIGESVEALIEAIGEPGSSDYAPSCMVDGEDGNLYYDGFIVYTQRTAQGETVYYVE